MQGQHERFDVVGAEVEGVGVGERVDAVDGRGHPGEEQGAEEEEGHARVEPGVRVGFLEGGVAGDAAHAEDFGSCGGAAVDFVGDVVADFYVDCVGIEFSGGFLGSWDWGDVGSGFLLVGFYFG